MNLITVEVHYKPLRLVSDWFTGPAPVEVCKMYFSAANLSESSLQKVVAERCYAAGWVPLVYQRVKDFKSSNYAVQYLLAGSSTY